ncbi:tyrosine-type recombinase/integrase [Acidiferrimicrobium sp. IK]|uniref:tyrosine-type recombinase/integrase n=1 Tax=Acidiferrimicrobium sp. IK TaxID=2871700 RepID=UPI0021CB7247|nr:tyrosine-type recombinase/integrase [Acidiferrimicrobium sp. IK]MCU4184040.1 tyrosine-type recombinase/integrase [Acidiferrimicrobium sp. IK]
MNESMSLPLLIAEYTQRGAAAGRFTADTGRRIGWRLVRLTVALGDRPASALDSEVIDEWLTSIAGYAPGTRRLNLSTVRCFCRWLRDRGVIPTDPTSHVKLPAVRSVPRAFTRDQVASLLEVLPDRRAVAIVRLMIDAGLRCVEVSRLQVSDYDPRDRTLLIVGKGGHERMLPAPAATAAALDAYLLECPAPAGPLLRSTQVASRALTAQYIGRIVGEWIEEAGIKSGRNDGRSAHALRHTAASDVLDACHDLRVVQEMLGHRSLTTTQIYLRRASLGQLREAMEGRDYRSAA